MDTTFFGVRTSKMKTYRIPEDRIGEYTRRQNTKYIFVGLAAAIISALIPFLYGDEFEEIFLLIILTPSLVSVLIRYQRNKKLPFFVALHSRIILTDNSISREFKFDDEEAMIHDHGRYYRKLKNIQEIECRYIIFKDITRIRRKRNEFLVKRKGIFLYKEKGRITIPSETDGYEEIIHQLNKINI